MSGNIDEELIVDLARLVDVDPFVDLTRLVVGSKFSSKIASGVTDLLVVSLDLAVPFSSAIHHSTVV